MPFHHNETGASLHIGPTILKNGSAVGARRGYNLIEGSNVTLTIVDNSGSDRVDITIASTGGAGGLTQDQMLNRVAFRA